MRSQLVRQDSCRDRTSKAQTIRYQPNAKSDLTGLGGDLDWSTLGTLLGGDASLALGSRGSGLGLVGLLQGLSGSLGLLALSDGGRASSGAGLWAHGAALLDDIEGSTNDSTLGLDGTAGALLGDLL